MVKIKNHKILNPKIWNQDGSLRVDVENVINNIVVSVITSLAALAKIPVDVEKDMEDYFICGSSANYFYRNKSDLDIKIIVNIDRYLDKMDLKAFDIYCNFVGNFFIKKYLPKINGISVDISITRKKYTKSCYSVKNNKWVIYPIRLTDEDFKYISYRSNLYYLAIKKMINNIIKDKNKHADIPKFYDYLVKKRYKSWSESFENRAPFSIAFSYIRDTGLIDKMLDINKELIQDLVIRDTD
ncbi:MAG: hypothetical protein JW974_02240 [Alphaproteobacteria bacterium]|nr:hypothetical protein [Alphaproteobacteria bacterium]MBN2675040.1 hypothetical protein [Alphaproteobacteria bacterium]